MSVKFILKCIRCCTKQRQSEWLCCVYANFLHHQIQADINKNKVVKFWLALQTWVGNRKASSGWAFSPATGSVEAVRLMTKQSKWVALIEPQLPNEFTAAVMWSVLIYFQNTLDDVTASCGHMVPFSDVDVSQQEGKNISQQKIGIKQQDLQC